MVRPEVDALLQGAIDDTLTPEERETLRQLMRDEVAVRDRAAELDQVNHLLSTLGPADAPPDLVDAVLARISPQTRAAVSPPVVHPFVRRSVPKRGVTVNKKIIFALAAAAVVILAVITYTSRPATTGTEATIGTAQRAQAPQIAASDVQLGDTEAQAFLQSEVFDELINDENTRTLLTDASLRASLADVDLRKAVEDEQVRIALRGAALKKMLEDQDLSRHLDAVSTYSKKIEDSSLRTALRNEAFLRAIRKTEVRAQMARAGFADFMARPAAVRALAARGVDRALLHPRFSEEMARAHARVQARAQARSQGARQQ